ncbi:MAG TPA: TerB family tellurite resistance protein [Rhodocyclaceae bacterium]
MLGSIQDFFRRQIEPKLADPGAADDSGLKLATAALLVEMMRMDRSVLDAERASVVATLTREFGVAASAIDELLALAEAEAQEATDYFQFTSLINRSASAAQKVRIIESMWRVAFADGHLDDHEAHLMKKVAGLLHIPHADYINAKTRAREGVARKG